MIHGANHDKQHVHREAAAYETFTLMADTKARHVSCHCLIWPRREVCMHDKVAFFSGVASSKRPGPLFSRKLAV